MNMMKVNLKQSFFDDDEIHKLRKITIGLENGERVTILCENDHSISISSNNDVSDMVVKPVASNVVQLRFQQEKEI